MEEANMGEENNNVNNDGMLNRLREMRQQAQRALMAPTPRYINGTSGATYPQLPFDPSMLEHSWEYAHRRSMQEIVPNVFLGPYAAACNNALETMLSAGLTHVVCVRQEEEKAFIRPNHPAHFQYMVVPIADSMTENIIGHFFPVIEFITNAIDNGGKVLVHGNCGLSRSAALVIAFLMNRYGATSLEALNYVQKKRFCANPSLNFMRQLQDFEPIYRARHINTAYAENPDPERFSIKRGHSESEDDGTDTQQPQQKIPRSDTDMMDEA